jgi:predicted permease
MGMILKDVQFSLRSLKRTRGFTFVAISLLALGISSNTIVFSVLDAILLRPLPYPDASNLLLLHWRGPYAAGGDVSAQAFFMLKEQAKSFENVSAVYPLNIGVNLSGTGSSRYLKALRVSREFFQTLKTAPAIGRGFLPEEDQPGGSRVAILSCGLWSSVFNRRPDALGRSLRINGESYIIVGFMPESFRTYPDADVWLPLQLNQASMERGNDYRVLARPRPGLQEEAIQSELSSISEDYRLKYEPRTVSSSKTLIPEKFQNFLVGDVRRSLEVLFGSVFLLLLIACTNLALLLLVRASGRRQELAMRTALGANRARLIQLVLCESLVIAFGGGLIGLILAKELLPLVSWFLPAGLPLSSRISINPHVLLFTLLVSVLTSVLVGLGPALRMSQVDLSDAIKGASGRFTSGRQQSRTERNLIAIQSALTLVLLAGATFLFRSFITLRAVPPGFNTQGILVAQVSLAADRYKTTEQTVEFVQRVSEALSNSSGAPVNLALSSVLPMEKGLNLPIFPADSPDRIEHAAEYRSITPEYFPVLQVPLLAGRFFLDGDDRRTMPVAIVNETLARTWWPNSSALGHMIKVAPEYGNPLSDDPRVVVGVVADVREAGLERSVPPALFIPLKQTPDKTMAFVNKLFLTSIAVRDNSANISSRIRHAVESADPDLSLATLRSLTEIVGSSMAARRFYFSLTGIFSLLALLLMVIGLYGLLSYRVVRRTREIAVRMALGGPRIGIIALVLKEGMTLVAVGVVLGLLGSTVLKPLLGIMIYNRSGSSLSVLATAAGLLLTVSAFTSLLAAFRAASIEPVIVLRHD